MLPVPNLDDRTFEQLVREAKDMIPRLAPQWTDVNEHDPGITLLELLAWHLELQQYQLNRLSIEFERKFLKLLGGAPRDRQPAATSVSFSHASEVTYLPFGTELTVGKLHFETVRSIAIIPDTTAMITLQRSDELAAVTQDMSSGRTAIYPFGEDGELHATMTISMVQPLPRGLPLSLWIELDQQDPDIRIPARYKQFIPSALVQWSYWQQEGPEEQEQENREQGRWLPLNLERDETYCLHQSGPVLFEIPEGAGEVKLIKAELVQGKYDDVPRIKRLMWNEVFASQGRTWCMEQAFAGWSEQDALLGSLEPIHIYLYHALYINGHIEVQIRVREGWIELPSHLYELKRSSSMLEVVVQPAADLAVGEQAIRVIAHHPEFVGKQYIATGSGISGQRCQLPLPSLYESSLRLQVGSFDAERGAMVWQDWQRVLDFDDSDPLSPHYVIEGDSIVFSDGIQGMAPPLCSTPNIRVISYRTGEGASGNVKEDTIRRMALWRNDVKLTNLFPAYGGAEAESVSEALARTKLDILSPKCGVTAADLEQRVREIPGIRIARVKAIAGYHTKLARYPEERAMGHVAIVVVPRSRRPFPLPSEGLCRTIAAHLEPYRLLTTKLHIIPPEYVEITIRAIIVVDPQYEGGEQAVVQALNQWLKPDASQSEIGWEFGKPIYKCDLYDYIHTIAGVQYIQDAWIRAEGKNVIQEAGGDIILPPNGLAHSGQHEIEFIVEVV